MKYLIFPLVFFSLGFCKLNAETFVFQNGDTTDYVLITVLNDEYILY